MQQCYGVFSFHFVIFCIFFKEKNMDLKEENKILKEKLALLKNFISREISSNINKINKNKADLLFGEKLIKDKIFSYFWENLLFSVSKEFIENIVSAEILFHHLEKNRKIDWASVINSYHKVLDLLIEKNISSLYRKFANKSNLSLKENDLVEKKLYSVVEKGYSLSFTRLFFIISKIKNFEKLFNYWLNFKKFLEKYYYIKEIILTDDFFLLAKQISDSWILWEKRHKWKISFEEVKKYRKILIWDFKSKNSLIYKLLKIWEIEI